MQAEAKRFASTPAELHEQVGVPYCGDSDPELKLNKARDANAWLRHTVLAADGGFHTMQAFNKSINAISKPLLESILRDKYYRNTLGKRMLCAHARAFDERAPAER